RDEGAFGCRVRYAAAKPVQGNAASYQDDGTALVLSHVRYGRPHAVEGSHDVHPQNTLPFVLGHSVEVPERNKESSACATDENIDATEVLRDSLHHHAYIFVHGNIATPRNSRHPEGLDFAGGLPGFGFRARVVDHDATSGARKLQGTRAPYAGRRPR